MNLRERVEVANRQLSKFGKLRQRFGFENINAGRAGEPDSPGVVFRRGSEQIRARKINAVKNIAPVGQTAHNAERRDNPEASVTGLPEIRNSKICRSCTG